jgi:anaerobic ribonucleoside-triphosphate reductase
MEKCQYCKDLNTEKEEMKIVEIYIQRAGYYGYRCPIKYCPNCGKILDKYKDDKERLK